MPFTPFHVAYPWLLRLKFRKLDFAGLTAGSMANDLEIPLLYLIGQFPPRLLGHSIFGAFTLNIIFSIFLFWLLFKIKIQRIGIHGFEKFHITRNFLLSAAIGSLTHIAIDITYHEHNPTLWPLFDYFGSPINDMFGPLISNLIGNTVTIILLLAIARHILKKDLGLVFSNPRHAMSIITRHLNR
ncbi:MAG: DUF4184 family protein [Candidatus Aenigmarchaeota archaeon]|nr:DUF4184 family protein [Candidatus Aenigmarchaeota archaeon]